MAGPFRGAVGKLKKTKSKGKKGKTSNALVKRSRKLKPDDVAARIDALISPDVNAEGKSSGVSSTTSTGSFLSKVKKGSTSSGTQKGSLLVVNAQGKMERVADPNSGSTTERSVHESQGLKLLHRAVKDQSFNRVLPHQERHDYEFKLRRMATLGVVRLFNSLAQAQTAGEALMETQKAVTIDKAQERKLVASRDAFLAALRTPTGSGAPGGQLLPRDVY